MKTLKTTTAEENHQDIVPVFDIIDADHGHSDAIDPSNAPLSFFDIKELYDRAYAAQEEGLDDYKSREIMAEAIKMDMTYRCQLARHSKYKKQSKINDFSIINTSL